MNFGEILKRAWQIIWNNKILWLFGILASCGSGGRGVGGGNFSTSLDNDNIRDMPPEMQRFFFDIERTFNRIDEAEVLGLIMILFAVICAVAILAFLLRTYGRVALIKGAAQAEARQKLSFGQLVRDSNSQFASALGLNFLLSLIPAIVGLLFAAFGFLTLGIGFLCLIPLICLLIPAGIAFNVLSEFANNALVLEGRDIVDSIRRGWQMLRDNLGDIALMALIVVVAGFVLGLIGALPMFVVILSGVGAVVFSGTAAFDSFGLLLAGFLAALLLTFVLSGILRSYISSVWTLTFLEIKDGPAMIRATVKPKTPKKKSPAKKAPPKKRAS